MCFTHISFGGGFKCAGMKMQNTPMLISVMMPAVKPFHFNCKVAILNHDIYAVDNQLHDKMDLAEVSICMRFVKCSDRKTEHTSRAQKNTVKRHDQ